jgi:hypothetical protein
MMMFTAEDEKLNEQEARLVGHPPGTPLKDLAGEALRLLTIWYFDRQIDNDFDGRYYGQCCCEWGFFALRLGTLSLLMGEAFDAIEAEKHEQWLRLCAEADAEERALAPCITCGGPRTLADEAFNKEDGLCEGCVREKEKTEHPFQAEVDEDPNSEDPIPS